MNITWLKTKSKVKGIFSSPIPYTPLIESGDSTPYYGTYEGQRYGNFDTDCCWDFSAAEIIETRLTLLRSLGMIPAETLTWLKQTGYIDNEGDFYISRRWVAILSGVRDGGNEQIHFWDIASEAGVIPNSMLPYSISEAQRWNTKEKFNNDYFNPQAITLDMENMGREFIKRFSIRAENLRGGWILDISNTLLTYLKEGSMQIGIPVPQDGSWNRNLVDFPKGRMIADHAIELGKLDTSIPYPGFSYDSYEPHLKQLSKDYYIPLVTRAVIMPKPVNTPISVDAITPWQRFWKNVDAWLRGSSLPYPIVPIGGSRI